MELDSEAQRQTLINCIQSAQISGMVAELVPTLRDIMGVLDAVKSAEIPKGINPKSHDIECPDCRYVMYPDGERLVLCPNCKKGEVNVNLQDAGRFGVSGPTGRENQS
jgi:hypothetical protein